MDPVEESEIHSQSVFCDPSSTNLRRVFSDFHLHFAKSASDADLPWLRRGFKPFYERLG